MIRIFGLVIMTRKYYKKIIGPCKIEIIKTKKQIKNRQIK